MTDREAILNLKDGESYMVPESDYGKAEIWLKNDLFFLFSIPFLGGTTAFEKAFMKCDIDELIKTYESWT
jgi:hypothetical protein